MRVTSAKYRNRRTTLDGVAFASAKEARHYAWLKIRERTGEIIGLECQPKYPLLVNGHKVGSYKPDFRYQEPSGRVHVVDVKGGKATMTTASRLRIRLFEACYPGLKVEIV